MFRTKAVTLVLITTLLAGGLPARAENARTAGQPGYADARAQATTTTGSQTSGKSREARPAKSCTYRGGPKTGSWDCR